MIGQRASILQCLDRPIENVLGAVKLVKIGVKYRGRNYWILIPNELDLSSPVPNDRTKFYQILSKIATVGAMTDRHTDRQTPGPMLYYSNWTQIMIDRNGCR